MCLGPELVAAAETVGSAASAAAPYALAATAASAYANNRSVKAQNAARDNAIEAERTRQHGFQEEANKAVMGATQGFDPAKQEAQLQALQSTREAAMPVVPAQTQGYQVPTASAPKEVSTDLGRKVSEALLSGKQAATRGAALKSFGDTELANNIALGRAGQDVGQLANYSHGSSNVLPMELQSAGNKGGNWGLAGDVLGSLGKIGMLYGATRKKPAPPTGYMSGLPGDAGDPYAMAETLSV